MDNSLKKGRITNYANKIGLFDTTKQTFINGSGDVILSFPFKDCILEGGMSDEESGREEKFFHETLDRADIDTLRDPKVLTGFEKIDKGGIHKVTSPDTIDFWDENEELRENLLIKGNNLVALYSLRQKLAGKVKLIYIDPPYNTGSDGFRYNDNFNHSTWLVFMRNRLEIARELLREDGVIFVQCDDNEQAYLKVLLDEVLGRKNYINTITIKAKANAGASGGGEDKRLKKSFEFILFYGKNYELAEFEQPDPSLIKISEFIQEHKENKIGFYYTRIIKDYGEKSYIGSTKDGSGEEIKIYKHSNYEFTSISKVCSEEGLTVDEAYEKYFEHIFMVTNAQTSILTKVNGFVGRKDEFISFEYVPRTGKDKGKLTTKYIWNETLVVWFKDSAIKDESGNVYKAEGKGTLWDDISWGRLDLEGDVALKSGKKPEQLLKRIIGMATEDKDIILDFCLGSGTTVAVAHKMGRRWIGIEQMDYIEDIAKIRLQKVIEGEQGGISTNIEWQGGGNFVYMELKAYNIEFIERIESARTKEELNTIYIEMASNAFLKFWFDRRDWEKDENYKGLPLEEQKVKLRELLDLNQLYLNVGDMNDSRHQVSALEKALTEKFYGKE